MNAVTVLGAIASAIAAGGVIWERLHWLRTRPRSDVRFGHVQAAEPATGLFAGDTGTRRAWVKNWGTEPAFDVEVSGVGCNVVRQTATSTELGIGEAFVVSVSPVEDRFTEQMGLRGIIDAWVLVTWTSPSSRRDRKRAAWFPVDEAGELAAIRARQLARGPIRQAVARRTILPQPTPASIPSGYVAATPSSAPRPLPPAPGRLRAIRLRRSLWKLFRVEPEWLAKPSEES